MPKGRHPGLELDPSDKASIAQEAAEIDSRGRIQIPAWIAGRVTWIAANTGSCAALGVLNEIGRIRLISWEQWSGPVLERRRELIKQENLRDLRLLEDVYRKIAIPKDLRPKLTAGMMAHLGLRPEVKEFIYLLGRSDSLEIFSSDVRDDELTRASAVLGDLPGLSDF